MISTAGIQLDMAEGEEVVFEVEGAVLTNQRLFTDWAAGRKRLPSPNVRPLRDIVSFQKITGGNESRLNIGIPALAIGVVLNLLSFIAQNGVPSFVENLLFLAGSMAFVIGLYLLLTSLLRVKPHTTLIFLVPGADDLPVIFPGKDNPKADQMTRLFVRTKRGI